MVYRPQTYQRVERRYSDEQAVLAVARRTPQAQAAYTEIYQRYYDPLVFHAYGILKNTQEAEDIVSEVLGEKFNANCAKLAQSADSGDLKLQAWFYRVTKNLCFNVMRDRKRRNGILSTAKQREDTALYALLSSNYGTNPTQDIYNRQLREKVGDAIAELSEPHQEILQLRYAEYMSYAEIAKTLDIKVGTVMSRLSRARDSLFERAPDLEELLAA